MAANGDTVSISEAIALLPSMPLYLERGVLQSIDATGIKVAETIEKLHIDNAVFRIPLASSKSGAALPAQSLQPLIAQLATFNVDKLVLRNARIEFVRDGGSTIALTEVSAEIVPSRRGSYSAKAKGNLNSQPIQIDASWTLPETKGQPPVLSRIPLKFTAKGNQLDAKFEGRIGLTGGLKLNGEVDIQARRLRALARWFGLEVPMSTNLRDARIVGPLEWSDGQLTFSKAVVTVDGNQGTGALRLKLGQERPALDGTLAFKVFDVKPHLEAMLLSTETARLLLGTTTESVTEGSLISAFDADLRLSASKVVMPRLETGRGAVTITLARGQMQAELAELEIEGGSASGQVTLDATVDMPRLGIKGRLHGVDPGRIFTEELKRNPLLGRANLVIDGSGNGDSLSGMIRSFSGKGSFALIDGGRLGLDLKALAYAVHRANHVGWSASGKGSTNLDQFETRFQVSNGALKLESLQAKSGNQTFSGSGKIDIRGQLFDLDISTGTISAQDTSNAGREASSRDVLVFRGPWSDPAISLLGRPFTGSPPVSKSSSVAAPAQALTGND